MSVDLRSLRHVPGPHQTCLRKITYSSWERAEQAALRLMEDAPDGKTPIVAYRCWYCDLWHIGHLPKKAATRRQARRKR